MDDLLPLLLWVFAVVWMLSVCGICIVRSRFGRGRGTRAEPRQLELWCWPRWCPCYSRASPSWCISWRVRNCPRIPRFLHRPLGDRRGDSHRVGFCGAVADGYPGASRAFHRSRPRGPRRHAYRGVTHASVRREYIVDVIDASHRGKSIRRQFRRVQFDVP